MALAMAEETVPPKEPRPKPPSNPAPANPAEMGEAKTGGIFQSVAERAVDADMGEPDHRDRQHQRLGVANPAVISAIGTM